MSASLTRSLRALKLRGAVPLNIRPIARNASTENNDPIPTPDSSASASASASASTSTPPPPSPSAQSSKSRQSKQTQYPLVLTHHPVPRSSESDSGGHQYINFPNKSFQTPSKDAFPERLGGNEGAEREKIISASTGLQGSEIRGLRRYTVRMGRVTQMTKKGKMPSFTALVVVGSPNRGLVGIGWGRGATNLKAMDQGFHKAALSMDYVTRYENRTLWGSGQDLTNKWGATKIIMRARPPGFGLMVPPALHRVFTACGIRDASATIEGSRNSVEVVKCAIQMLHGGANPPGFGSGLSGRGRREDKGAGIRSKDEIERERGRYGVDIGRRV